MTHQAEPLPSEIEENNPGEFIALIRYENPTEARLMAGCLVASGIPATTADGDLIQADALLAIALGGVRVMVPEKLIHEARQVMAEFEQGTFQLASDDDEQQIKQKVAVWNPDAAALLSLLFTPLFGAILQYKNSRLIGDARLKRFASIWLVLSISSTFFGIMRALYFGWNAQTFFIASLICVPFTLLWYLVAGLLQGSYISKEFGKDYPRKNLWFVSAVTAISLFGLGAIGALLD